MVRSEVSAECPRRAHLQVEGDYTGYGVADWLVVAATFLVCVDIWHEYLMTVLSHVWLPGCSIPWCRSRSWSPSC
jgi:hypothetical protein